MSYVEAATDGAHHVVRNVVRGQFLFATVEHGFRLVELFLLNQVKCQQREQATVGVAHAHDGLVEVYAFLAQTTVLVALHDVLVHLLCIEVLGSLCIRREWRDAIGQTFLYEVVAEVHVVLYVDGAHPVALSYHFKHHQVAFVECPLARKRDDHAVGDAVCSHHHAALAHGFFVDGDVESIGRDGVVEELSVFTAAVNERVEHVFQLERLRTHHCLGLLRMVAVEVKYLLFALKVDFYVFVSPRTVVEARPSDRNFG